MKYILTLLTVIVGCIIMLLLIIPLENQLSDCQFECNHLQTKLHRLQELSDYIPAMEQVLNSMQLAELKALTEQIRQQKYKVYESIEMSILTEKEKRK